MRKSNNSNDWVGANAANIGDVSKDLKEHPKQIEAPEEQCQSTLAKHWKKVPAKIRKKYPLPGRPPKFESVEDLYEGVLAYFEQCDGRTIKKTLKCSNKKVITIDLPDPAPKVVSQMCRFLGISRRTWYNYNQPDHPFYIICEWFDMISESSWYDVGEDPRKTSLAIFVLQTKFRKETRMLEKEEMARLAEEIDIPSV
ncbi:MAG: hypothetical protein GXY61_03745 [Lentisphaerae bacterium]|nr:hypothetical protein [Lentisphaerota bacterium]